MQQPPQLMVASVFIVLLIRRSVVRAGKIHEFGEGQVNKKLYEHTRFITQTIMTNIVGQTHLTPNEQLKGSMHHSNI